MADHDQIFGRAFTNMDNAFDKMNEAFDAASKSVDEVGDEISSLKIPKKPGRRSKANCEMNQTVSNGGVSIQSNGSISLNGKIVANGWSGSGNTINIVDKEGKREVYINGVLQDNAGETPQESSKKTRSASKSWDILNDQDEEQVKPSSIPPPPKPPRPPMPSDSYKPVDDWFQRNLDKVISKWNSISSATKIKVGIVAAILFIALLGGWHVLLIVLPLLAIFGIVWLLTHKIIK